MISKKIDFRQIYRMASIGGFDFNFQRTDRDLRAQIWHRCYLLHYLNYNMINFPNGPYVHLFYSMRQQRQRAKKFV